jgi:formiminoglutamase
MLNHWLKPYNHTSSFSPNQLGGQITFFDKDFPSLANIKTVLIGIDAQADSIREHLYTYASFGDYLPIADLGNIRKQTNDFIIPILHELLQLGITPVLLCGSPEIILAQFQTYQALLSKLNLTVIDEKIRLNLTESEQEYLNVILEKNQPIPLHLSSIGFQAHLTHQDILSYFDLKQYDAIRLGQLRAQPEEIEPIIRDADAMLFSLSALRQSDAPAQVPASLSGLSIEEGCRLTRYAGMSDRLSSLSIFGYDLANDTNHLSEQAMAQLVWYFWDGFLSRKNDFPASTDGLVEYIVDYKLHNYTLTFWRSAKSGRWWMQIPINTKNMQTQHQLISCSYKDYQAACNGELPERLFHAISRNVQ